MFLLLFLILTQIGFIVSDLPVHCLHYQVKGKWNFIFSQLHKKKIECGYHHPDRNSDHFPDQFDFEPTLTMEFELRAPNEVVNVNNSKIGTWTMVYDEGFAVTLDTLSDGSKVEMFSFMEYEPKSSDHLTENVKDYTSYCDRTRLGWIQQTTSSGMRLYGCHKGKQLNKELLGDSLSLISKTQVKKKSSNHLLGYASEIFYDKDDQLYEPDYTLIETINNDKSSTWKATAHKQFIGKTVKEMSALLGRNRFQSITSKDQPKATVRPAPVSLIDIANSETHPSSLDWRDINGTSFINTVRDQMSCGSCYAMASLDAFSSRFNIVKGTPQKIMLSTQDVLSCSTQNQGCQGGYPFLVAKYGKEEGFIPEMCMEYTAKDKIPCEAAKSTCPKAERLFLKDYEYVGGYYGGCNEIRMIDALQTGPIVAAFNAKNELFAYRSGIYDCDDPPESEQQFGETSNVREWEKTTHAVVIVGYGKDVLDGENVNYWIVKNSWGPDWGEKGYFKIKRGENSCAIESMTITGTPLVI